MNETSLIVWVCFLGVLIFSYLTLRNVKKSKVYQDSASSDLFVHSGFSPGTPEFIAEKWNKSLKIGVPILYEKSKHEGNLKSKTIGLAYVMGVGGNKEAFIDVQHLGSCSLGKIEVDHTVDYRKFLK